MFDTGMWASGSLSPTKYIAELARAKTQPEQQAMDAEAKERAKPAKTAEELDFYKEFGTILAKGKWNE